MSEEEKFQPREYVDIVLGYSAAHFVELAMKPKAGTPITTEEEMDKAARLNAILEAAFLIAAADGELTEEEFATIAKAAKDLFEQATQQEPYREIAEPFMTDQELNAILQSFADLLDEQGYAKRVAYIAETLPSDEMRQKAFMLAVNLSMNDGKVPDSENTVIHELAKAFGFPAAKTNQLLDSIEAARKPTESA